MSGWVLQALALPYSERKPLGERERERARAKIRDIKVLGRSRQILDQLRKLFNRFGTNQDSFRRSSILPSLHWYTHSELMNDDEPEVLPKTPDFYSVTPLPKPPTAILKPNATLSARYTKQSSGTSFSLWYLPVLIGASWDSKIYC